MKRNKQAILEGIAKGRPLQGPSSIHIDVTNACNANCITCWDHSPLLSTPQTVAWKRQRVTLEQVEALVEDVMSLGGLSSVVLSGMGDPFVHPEIYELIRAVKSRRLHLTIITNLIPARAEEVVTLDVDQLLIGIHGASLESYLAFHPNFTARDYDTLNASLRYFAAHRRRYKQVQVICKVNAHELVDMVQLGHDTCAGQVNFKLASLKNGTEDVLITDAQREDLVRRIVPAAQSLAKDLGVATNLDNFAMQLEAGGAKTAPIEQVGCFMGYAYSRITVDGTVLYCCNTEMVIGSLQGGARFSELWNGASWNAMRDKLRAGDYARSCSQCGKFNQNVEWSERFRNTYGKDVWRRVIGLDAPRPTNHSRLPVVQ